MTHRHLSITLAVLAALTISCRGPEPHFGASGQASASPQASDNGAQGPTHAASASAQANAGTQTAAPAAPIQGVPAGVDLLHPPAQDFQAPEHFAVELDTSKGPLTIDVTRAWSPHGADRFYTLVRLGYFQQVAFFRVLEGFMAQVGIHGDPAVNQVWEPRRIPDDRVVQHNTRGMVSFATSGPNSRVNQFFINFADNSRLDGMGFSPFGHVRDMHAADALYPGYGEGAPSGRGPSQGRITHEGNPYLAREFPRLDYLRDARVVPAQP